MENADSAGLDRRDCFVIMPFGTKTLEGRDIDFDKVYSDLIKPATEAAGLNPVRADTITHDNLIGRRMFDRLAHAPYVLADGTFLNANVFYELGVRHTLRRTGTVTIAEAGTPIPFDNKDVDFLRYAVDPSGAIADLDARRSAITQALVVAQRNSEIDSPLALHLHNLDVRYKSPRLASGPSREYKLSTDERWRIGWIPGDLIEVKSIDAWVNSENRYMMMARFFDQSISGLIRYHGAERVDNEIRNDHIQRNLTRKMNGRRIVELATVLDTGPGRLRQSNNVKRIFHVASVDASQDSGYRIDNAGRCVSAVLEEADRYNRNQFGQGRVTSIIMPLFGTGMASVSPEIITDQLLEGALKHYKQLKRNEQRALARCYFLVFTERDRDALERSIAKRRGELTAA